MSASIESTESTDSTNWEPSIRDDTEYALGDDETRTTRELLAAEGFAADELVFATFINGEDDIRYAMFVGPDGQVRELEHDIDTNRLRLRSVDDIQAAVRRVPQLPTALKMAGRAKKLARAAETL